MGLISLMDKAVDTAVRTHNWISGGNKYVMGAECLGMASLALLTESALNNNYEGALAFGSGMLTYGFIKGQMAEQEVELDKERGFRRNFQLRTLANTGKFLIAAGLGLSIGYTGKQLLKESDPTIALGLLHGFANSSLLFFGLSRAYLHPKYNNLPNSKGIIGRTIDRFNSEKETGEIEQ